MPKVKALTNKEKVNQKHEQISKEMIDKIKCSDCKQSDIARLAGLTQGAISQQFRNKKLSLKVYLICDMMLKGELR